MTEGISYIARRAGWLAALAAGVALHTGVGAQSAQGIEVFTSGSHFYKRVVTNENPQTTSSLDFIGLPGASTTIFVPPQSIVLVNVGFDAETRCSGGGTQASWCELRINIGGVEGSPQSSTSVGTFAMDSTDQGSETASSWESHAVTRHRCVRNTTNTPLAVTVQVDWKISNFAPAAGVNPPEFWIDDSSLVVEMARGCTVSSPSGADVPSLAAPNLRPTQGSLQ